MNSEKRNQRCQPAGNQQVRKHQPAGHKDRTGADMDQLAARFTIDPATMCNEVHQAEENEGNGKRKDGGDAGVHIQTYTNL